MANKRYKYTLPTDGKLNGKQLKIFIDTHQKDDVVRYQMLDSYIDDTDDPVRDREAPNDILVVNNFAKYITRINNGYMLGKPVSYEFADTVAAADKLIDAYKSQSIDDLDAEIAEACSTYGVGYERIYIDEQLQPRSTELEPENTFIVYDRSVARNKLYAVNYEPVLDDSGNPAKDNYNVTIISATDIIDGKLSGDIFTRDTKKTHSFNDVPVIEYPNNKRLSGDFEAVIKLIDEYDFTQSDRAIDREKLVDAILAFYGVKVTEEDRKAIKDSRTISLPDSNAKGEYITKDIDEAGADLFRQSLAADIHKFSFTPDLSDKEFAGNSSGVALLYKLVGFFWNVGVKARYFEAGLRERAVLYSRFLSKAKKSGFKEIAAHDVDVVFNGTMPQNDKETSEMINNLIGVVSNETLMGQLSFIADARTEISKLGTETRPRDNFGTDEPTDNPDPDNDNPEPEE
jgi:SPP1 family phage portal protein